MLIRLHGLIALSVGCLHIVLGFGGEAAAGRKGDILLPSHLECFFSAPHGNEYLARTAFWLLSGGILAFILASWKRSRPLGKPLLPGRQPSK